MIPPRALRRLSSNERGIALVAAILVVLLSSVLVMTFMTTTTGERAQSSNVQTAKISLYAADAGVRTQQQVLANLAQAKVDSCVIAFNNAGSIGLVITNPSAMFPNGTFSTSSTNPPFAATASLTWADSSVKPAQQSYDYGFTIQSTGSVGNTGRRSIQTTGVLRVSAERGTFADYLMFMDQFTMPDGSSIWLTSAGNFDGRVHTNTFFRFAYKPTFQDLVTQRNANATYYNNGSPVSLNANNNGSIDVPNFYSRFDRNQAGVPLPTDSYNQQGAALGLSIPPGTPPTNAQINTAIGSGAGNGAPPNGIYVPNASGSVTGGIYLQGSVDQVKMWADTTNNKQYYKVTQGGTIRTICVDRTGAGSTRVWNSANFAGAPNNSYVGVPPNNVLYTTGSINDLRGPDRGNGGTVLPAIADNNKLMITAVNDIVIQRDITCDDFNSPSPSNVLGIFSSSGAVRVGTGAPDYVNVDAYIMATGSANGAMSVDNYNSGSQRGTFNLRGGLIAKFYGAFYTFDGSGNVKTGYGRNFHYDGRGLVPPFFPTTNRFKANSPTARIVAWKEI